MPTNSIVIRNIDNAAIAEMISSEFLIKFCPKINTKIIAKVNRPNIVLDINEFNESFPRIIQLIDTTAELATSTIYGIHDAQKIHAVQYPKKSLCVLRRIHEASPPSCSLSNVDPNWATTISYGNANKRIIKTQLKTTESPWF